MDLERNAPCPCGSGKKLKQCCLDDFLAWRRAGKGIIAAYVEHADGTRCSLSEWTGPLELDTTVVTELNPITQAWARNTLPAGASCDDPAYRALLLKHFAALAGDRLSSSLAAELVEE